jgi:hypothetical protein
MPLIPLDAAAARLGVPRTTIEDWVQRGLLTLHDQAVMAHVLSSDLGKSNVVPCVEEEQLFDVAESMGWLELSAEHWDGDGED